MIYVLQLFGISYLLQVDSYSFSVQIANLRNFFCNYIYHPALASLHALAALSVTPELLVADTGPDWFQLYRRALIDWKTIQQPADLNGVEQSGIRWQ